MGEGKGRGRRFGTLVHAVLREVPLDAGTSFIKKSAELNGRILGAPTEEIESASACVSAALAHPLLDRARTSARCHREYPITLALKGRRLMEGVIDLAFVEDDAWVVVDFKTDTDISGHRAQYERQLQWYAYALRQRLTGLPPAHEPCLLGLPARFGDQLTRRRSFGRCHEVISPQSPPRRARRI